MPSTKYNKDTSNGPFWGLVGDVCSVIVIALIFFFGGLYAIYKLVRLLFR